MEKIKNLPLSSVFTLRKISAPKCSQVYVRGLLDVTCNKYKCYKYNDNSVKFFDADKKVFVDFYFMPCIKH